MRDGVLIARIGKKWEVLGLPGDPVQDLQATFKRARGVNCALDSKPFDEVRLYEGGCFQVTKRTLPVIQAEEPKTDGKKGGTEDPKADGKKPEAKGNGKKKD